MPDARSEKASQHPTDQRIRELIRVGRQATSQEIARLIDRMTTVPFDQRPISAPIGLSGRSYLGRVVQAREDAWFAHLIKRVIEERQWAEGTTASQYLDDLRRAVQHPTSRLLLYVRRGGHHAAVIADTQAILGAGDQGDGALPLMLVVYSADRGILITGYQFSDWSKVQIPGDALWLKRPET